MKRLILVLLFALPVHAGPREWVKRHPVATRIIASVIVDGALARGMYNAGKPNPENAQCHYGPTWGCFGIDVALNGVMQLVGYKVGGKTGATISFGSDAVEGAFAGYEWNGGPNKPLEDHDETSTSDFRKYLRPAGVRR